MAKKTRRNEASFSKSALVDPIWSDIRAEATSMIENEPIMAGAAQSVVLEHDSLEYALAFRLAQKLGNQEMPPLTIIEAFKSALSICDKARLAIRADLAAVRLRDPACDSYLQPLMFFKGFLALQAYRAAHYHWTKGAKSLAYFIQMRVSEAFDVDIHPGAKMGKGIMVDHATGLVIGETAVIDDDVSLLHGVTLGGTGKDDSQRHPQVESGVMIGANASVLGNIRIGKCSRIAAGSVVLHDVLPCKTVAGVPARVVGDAGCDNPASSMDQQVD